MIVFNHRARIINLSLTVFKQLRPVSDFKEILICIHENLVRVLDYCPHYGFLNVDVNFVFGAVETEYICFWL